MHQQQIAHYDHLSFAVHESVLNSKILSPRAGQFLKNEEINQIKSPSGNSGTSPRNFNNLKQAGDQLMGQSARSGYSQNMKNETLTKIKFQKEFEGKKVPFRIQNIERNASMKAYQSLTKTFIKANKNDGSSPRQNPIDFAAEDRSNQTFTSNGMKEEINFQTIDDGTQIAAQTLMNSNSSYDQNNLRTMGDQYYQQLQVMEAHISNRKLSNHMEDYYKKSPQNKLSNGSFLLNTASNFSPNKAVVYGSAAYKGLKANRNQKNKKNPSNILGTKDLFGESFMQNINGKPILKPFTKNDELQFKHRFQLPQHKNQLGKYSVIKDQYKNKQKDTQSLVSSNLKSNVQLPYFERIYIANEKFKSNERLKSQRSLEAMNSIQKPSTRHFNDRDDFMENDHSLQKLKHREAIMASATYIETNQATPNGPDNSFVVGQQTTEKRERESKLALNKDFGFGNIVVNNQAPYIDVNQLDNQTNPDDEMTHSYSPLKFPVRLNTKEDAQNTKQITVSGIESAMKVLGTAQTPMVQSDSKMDRMKNDPSDHEILKSALIIQNLQQQQSKKKIISVKRQVLPKAKLINDSMHVILPGQSAYHERTPIIQIPTDTSPGELNMSKGIMSNVGIHSQNVMSPRMDYEQLSQLMIQRGAHMKLESEQASRLINVGFVNSIAAPIVASETISNAQNSYQAKTFGKLAPSYGSRGDLSSSLEGANDEQRERLLRQIEEKHDGVDRARFGLTFKSGAPVNHTLNMHSPANKNDEMDQSFIFQENDHINQNQQPSELIDIKNLRTTTENTINLYPSGAASKVHLRIDPQLTRNLNNQQSPSHQASHQELQADRILRTVKTGKELESAGTMPNSIIPESMIHAGSVINADLTQESQKDKSSEPSRVFDGLDQVLSKDVSVFRLIDNNILRQIEENTLEDGTLSHQGNMDEAQLFQLNPSHVNNINNRMLSKDMEKIYVQNLANINNLQNLREIYQNNPGNAKILGMITQLQSQIPVIEQMSRQIKQQTQKQNTLRMAQRRHTVQENVSQINQIKYVPQVARQLQKYQDKFKMKQWNRSDQNFDELNMTHHDSLKKKKEDILNKQQLTGDQNLASPQKHALKQRHSSVGHQIRKPKGLSSILQLPHVKTKRPSPMIDIQMNRNIQLHMPQAQQNQAHQLSKKKLVAQKHQGSGCNLSSVHSANHIYSSNYSDESLDYEGAGASPVPQQNTFLASQYSMPFNPNTNLHVAASSSKIQQIEYNADLNKHQTQKNFEIGVVINGHNQNQSNNQKISKGWQQVKPTAFLANMQNKNSQNSLMSMEGSNSGGNLGETKANTFIKKSTVASENRQFANFIQDFNATEMNSGSGKPHYTMQNGTYYFNGVNHQEGQQSPQTIAGTFGHQQSLQNSNKNSNGNIENIKVGAQTLMQPFQGSMQILESGSPTAVGNQSGNFKEIPHISLRSPPMPFTPADSIQLPTNGLGGGNLTKYLQFQNSPTAQDQQFQEFKKTVALRMNQTNFKGGKNLSSPQATDGGFTAKLSEQLYLNDPKLSNQMTTAVTNGIGTKIKNKKPKLNKKKGQKGYISTVLIQNQQIIELSKEEPTHEEESSARNQAPTLKIPGISEIIEFEKGNTEYQENSRSPVLTPNANEMKKLNQLIIHQQNASAFDIRNHAIRTEEDDIVTDPINSPRSPNKFSQNAPSPQLNGLKAITKGFNNTSKLNQRSQPLLKNSEESSQQNSNLKSSPSIKHPESGLRQQKSDFGKSSMHKLNQSKMSKDLHHVIDQPIVNDTPYVVNDTPQIQTQSPFLRNPGIDPLTLEHKNDKKFEFTEVSYRSNLTGQYSPRGLDRSHQDMNASPRGFDRSHQDMNASTLRMHANNQLPTGNSQSKIDHTSQGATQPMKQISLQNEVKEGKDSPTRTVTNTGMSPETRGVQQTVQFQGRNMPSIKIRLSSNSVQQLLDSKGSQERSKGNLSVESFKYEDQEISNSPMMVQGTNPYLRGKKESQMNIQNQGAQTADINIQSQERLSTHFEQPHQFRLEQVPVAQFKFGGLPEPHSITPNGLPNYAESQQKINQTYQQRLLHNSVSKKSKNQADVKGVGLESNGQISARLPDSRLSLQKFQDQATGLRLSKSNVTSVKKLADSKMVGAINVNVNINENSTSNFESFEQQSQIQNLQQYALSGTKIGIRPISIQEIYEGQQNKLIIGENYQHQNKNFVEKYFHTKQNHEIMIRATDKNQKVKMVRQKEAITERLGAQAMVMGQTNRGQNIQIRLDTEEYQKNMKQSHQKTLYDTMNSQSTVQELVNSTENTAQKQKEISNFKKVMTTEVIIGVSANEQGPKFSSLRGKSNGTSYVNYLQQTLDLKYKEQLLLGGATLQGKKLKKPTDQGKEGIIQQKERFQSIINSNRNRNHSNIF